MKHIMLSGYKPHELGVFDAKHPGVAIIQKAIEKRLRALIEEGLTSVFISGQQGTELWGAEVVLKLKKEFPDLKLAVVTPFLHQEKNWKEEARLSYESIVQKADFVTSISNEEYQSPAQFQRRDQAVMNRTDGLLLVYDDEREGTPKFLKTKALRFGETAAFPVLLIDFYELQSIAEEAAEAQRNDMDF